MATPYMNLTLPTVSVTLGPLWATELNAALTLVDSHNHTSGKGLAIQTAALNINADLTFNSYNAIALRSLRLSNQSAPLALSGDIGCLYESLGNLYYNNSSGTPIRITVGSALDASSIGGIGGDYVGGSATEFYTLATTSFYFWSNSNVSANIDCGNVIIRKPLTVSAPGITLASPTLSSGYQLTFPTALPGAKKILTVDASGIIDDSYDVDNSTLEVNTNTLRIKDNGVVTAKILNANVTRPKLVAVGQQTSPSCGAFTLSTSETDITNLTVTITTTGRPVILILQSDGSVGNIASMYVYNPTGIVGAFLYMNIYRGASIIASYQNSTSFTGTAFPDNRFNSIIHIDPVAAGTYTYKITGYKNTATTSAIVNYYVLAAYEL